MLIIQELSLKLPVFSALIADKNLEYLASIKNMIGKKEIKKAWNGLDNQGVEDVRKILQNLKNEGKSIILASHNKEDIEVLCDEVCEMDHGKLTVSE